MNDTTTFFRISGSLRALEACNAISALIQVTTAASRPRGAAESTFGKGLLIHQDKWKNLLSCYCDQYIFFLRGRFVETDFPCTSCTMSFNNYYSYVIN